MKTGFKTTEFYVVGGVVVIAILMSMGLIKPELFDRVAGNIDVAGEKIPLVWAAILRLIEQLAPLAGAVALAYSYLSNRTAAKRTEAAKEVKVAQAEAKK